MMQDAEVSGTEGAAASAWEVGAAAVVVAGAALYAGWQLLIGGSETAETLASNIATPTLSVAATLMAWRAARRSRREPAIASGWRRLALAIAFMALGDLVWALGESLFGIEPTVGWHDVPFLVSYPLLLWALLSFAPRFRRRTEELKFWLDSLTVLVGAGMLVWYFILYPTVSRPGTDPLARGIAIAYIVGDLILLFGIATTLLRRPPVAARTALGIVVAGLLLQLGGDLALARGALAVEYVTGGLTDVLWVLSYATLVVAGLAQIRGVRPAMLLRARRPRLLPYAAILAGYGLMLYVAGRDESPAVLGLIVCAVLLTGLVVARQLVSVAENQRLAQEIAAQRSEARFRSLVQHSSDVITILDRAGRITYQSPSAERILGPAAARAMGSPFAAFAHPDDAVRLQSFIAEAPSSRLSGPVAWRMPSPESGWLYLESSASNLLDDPTVGGVVINTRDITERRHLEFELGQAMKMEAVGRLAGGVAHDFNNLLTIIQGHTSLLLERRSETAEREELAEIERAARRAAALTRQLLAFSRKQVLQPRVLDPNSSIRDLQPILRRLLRQSIEIVLELDPAAGHVLADPAQFEQILLNLCVNAGDAMPEGGRLTIGTAPERAADGGPRLLLTVSDTGAGMDEATLARIFEPFFTTKPPGEGRGLGLATVYGIIEQSGGTIEVDSTPGKGTVFRVRLTATSQHRDRGAATGDRVRQTGRETVLLVEDEAGVRRLARKALQLHGYQVIDAADGADALELVKEGIGPVHLLLTDVIMPRIGGPELARELLRVWPDLRVLFMSGYTDDEAVLQGALAGGAAFFQKPFTPRELVEKVREVLDSPAPGAQG